MAVRIALLGFGTVATGLPFLLEENRVKLQALVGDEFVIEKCWSEMRPQQNGCVSKVIRITLLPLLRIL